MASVRARFFVATLASFVIGSQNHLPVNRQSSIVPESLSGLIERVTFFNVDNGYGVLNVKAKSIAIWTRWSAKSHPSVPSRGSVTPSVPPYWPHAKSCGQIISLLSTPSGQPNP